ncbi:MAG: hypothetical protein GEV09_17180 [Pseudonocardiaceae bacterium]|nr:hypothetical protein [Pseudonocardiaceae bacterium]
MTVPEYVPTRPRTDWAWRGGPEFTAPDGSHIRLDRPGLNSSQPWSCAFVARAPGARDGLTVAEIGAFDWHVTYTMPGAEVTATPFAGGELLVASLREPPEYRAAWRGQWFELHHRAPGPVPAGGGVGRVFDALRLTDTPTGMLASPRTAAVRFEPFQVAKAVPGIGALRIGRPGEAGFDIPRFRGRSTRHGEIWRRPLGDGARGRARDELLLLATSTAVTQLIPGPRDTADADTALAFLEELTVSWEPA